MLCGSLGKVVNLLLRLVLRAAVPADLLVHRILIEAHLVESGRLEEAVGLGAFAGQRIELSLVLVPSRDAFFTAEIQIRTSK